MNKKKVLYTSILSLLLVFAPSNNSCSNNKSISINKYDAKVIDNDNYLVALKRAKVAGGGSILVRDVYYLVSLDSKEIYLSNMAKVEKAMIKENSRYTYSKYNNIYYVSYEDYEKIFEAAYTKYLNDNSKFEINVRSLRKNVSY